MIRDDVKRLLPYAEKPARYTGGELNTPPPKDRPLLKYLLCLPDVYEVAMSNLGIRILYDILNMRPDTECHNCFAPIRAVVLQRRVHAPLRAGARSARRPQ